MSNYPPRTGQSRAFWRLYMVLIARERSRTHGSRYEDELAKLEDDLVALYGPYVAADPPPEGPPKP